jgi:hypothetical protein
MRGGTPIGTVGHIFSFHTGGTYEELAMDVIPL